MNYTEAVAYIEELPKFTTKNPPEHTRKLLFRLGNPEKQMKIIHVAGTNGKGSVCAYLNSMLMAGGRSVGLFTSPHLEKINERFQINGKEAGDDVFLSAFLRVEEEAKKFEEEGQGHPSYFETLFLMGMLIFAGAGVEYLVMETGLGGRLDATNVVEHPLAVIITSISKDHMEYLGDTLEKIAAEKAGIIKPGVPVIYDAKVPEVSRVIEKRAKELAAPCYPMCPEYYRVRTQTREGITFSFSHGEEPEVLLSVPYVAEYQMMNASLAFYTMKLLEPVHGIPEQTRIQGIAGTRWPCRMETVLPGVVIDGAHNEDGVAEFVKTASYFGKDQEITILFSAVCDKEYRKMIHEICEGIQPDHVVATQIEGKRIVPAEELAADFRDEGCRDVIAEENIGEAFEKACSLRGEGMVFCVGSLYLAGELKKYISTK